MITEDYHILTPAYGRDYKTEKEVQTAFLNGADFNGDIMLKFKRCSVRDFAPGVIVNLYYRHLDRVTVVTVPEPGSYAAKAVGD